MPVPESLNPMPPCCMGVAGPFEMKTLTILSLGVAIAQSGCILPVPHRRLHVEGVKGRVVSAATHRPIAGAKVSSAITRDELAITGSDGSFVIQPDHGWHGAMLIGPVSYSLLPHFDMPSPPSPIRISAAGFRAKEYRDRRELAMKVFPLDPK